MISAKNKYIRRPKIVILRRKCTLSHRVLPSGESSSIQVIKRRDRQTIRADGYQTVTLRLPLDADRVINPISVGKCSLSYSFPYVYVKVRLPDFGFIRAIDLHA